MTQRERQWLLAMRDLRDAMYAPCRVATGCEECEEDDVL